MGPLARLLLAGAVSALAACSMAPTYRLPATAPAPQSYRESGEWKPAQPADELARGTWWTVFRDPALDALESRVGVANQDLKASYARLLEARALTRIARAEYFPTLTAGPRAARSHTSAHAPTFTAAAPVVTNDFVLEADVAYEIDLWGRVRNAVVSARANEAASAADLASFDLSTHAELAVDYFLLRGLDAEQQILELTVASYQRALDLTRNLYRGGAAPVGDLRQAEAQLASARTQAADIGLRRAQLEHAVAVLVGESASTFRLDASPLALGVDPPPIDPGLPSALLERRPDVAAAERRVAAANAGVGVARAAYFPVFGLQAAAGFESTTASNWITAPSRLWSIGPSAVLTVFDAGLHRAQSAQARATYDEQVANYRGTVLRAYQEVEDQLAALRELEHESISEGAAVTAAQGALDQANFRYKGGLVTYLEVVTTENTALAARLSAVDIEVRRLSASIALVKALGGGWTRVASEPATR